VIRVVGQREVARQIDLDPVPLADGDGRKHVQELVEDLGGGLCGALGKSLPHKVGSGGRESPRGSALRDGATSWM